MQTTFVYCVDLGCSELPSLFLFSISLLPNLSNEEDDHVHTDRQIEIELIQRLEHQVAEKAHEELAKALLRSESHKEKKQLEEMEDVEDDGGAEAATDGPDAESKAEGSAKGIHPQEGLRDESESEAEAEAEGDAEGEKVEDYDKPGKKARYKLVWSDRAPLPVSTLVFNSFSVALVGYTQFKAFTTFSAYKYRRQT